MVKKFIVFFLCFVLQANIVISQDEIRSIDREIQKQRELLKQKNYQLAVAKYALSYNNAATNMYEVLYEQAVNKQIPVYSFDDIRAIPHAVPEYILVELAHIAVDEQALLSFKSKSADQQWQYFMDYKKCSKNNNDRVHSIESLGKSLEKQLKNKKETIVQLVHDLRSENISRYYLPFYEYGKQHTHFGQQFVQKLEQDTITIVDAMSCNEQRAQQVARHQHTMMQEPVNRAIIELGQAKSAQRKQAKKERVAQEKAESAIMSREELLTQQLLAVEKKQKEVVASIEKISQAIAADAVKKSIGHVHDVHIQAQSLLTAAPLADQQGIEQAAIDVDPDLLLKKQAKKAKESARKQRKKQAAADALLVSQIKLTEAVCKQEGAARNDFERLSPLLQFGANLTRNLKHRSDYVQKLRVQSCLTVDEKNKLLYRYDEQYSDKSKIDLLSAYTKIISDSHITDENLLKLQEFAGLIVRSDEELSWENHRISWYLYFSNALEQKIAQRYDELKNQYSDQEQIEKNKIEAHAYALHIDSMEKKLEEFRDSISEIMSPLKKIIADNHLRTEIDAEKAKINVLLEKIKEQKDLLEQAKKVYEYLHTKERAAEVYMIMKNFHSQGGILDTSRLHSEIDFSTWQASTFGAGVLESKFASIHNDIADLIKRKEALALENIAPRDAYKNLLPSIREILTPVLTNIFKEIGLAEEDYSALADAMIQRTPQYLQNNPRHLDTIEFHIHEMFERDSCDSDRNYSLEQINDVAKTYILLLEQFTPFFTT